MEIKISELLETALEKSMKHEADEWYQSLSFDDRVDVSEEFEHLLETLKPIIYGALLYTLEVYM